MPVLPDPYVLRDREQVAALMKERKLSLRTLAQAAELGKSPVHRILTGQQATCSYPVAERLANALGVELAELFRPKHVEGE